MSFRFTGPLAILAATLGLAAPWRTAPLHADSGPLAEQAFVSSRPAFEPGDALDSGIDTLYESWRWVHFTTASGLPSNRVNSVVETGDGTAWASTTGGVAWYDGYRWHPMDDGDGIPAGRPLHLSVHGNQLLAVGPDHHLYRGTTESFARIPLVSAGRDLRAFSALSLTADRILVLTSETTLSEIHAYTIENGRLVPFDHPSRLLWTQQSPQMWPSRAGGIWLNTLHGLHQWKDGEWIERIRRPEGAILALRGLAEDEHGAGVASLVLPSNMRGLWEWGADAPMELNRNEPGDQIEALDIGPDGEVMVVYRSGDAWMRRGGDWSALAPVPPAMDKALFVKYRSNGDLWLGTERGLYIHRRSLSRWSYWQVDSPSLRNEINEILLASDGSVWLATGRGLVVLRPDGGREEIESILGTELHELTALAEGADGSVWVASGSSFHGAFRWDGTQWQHYGRDEGLAASRTHKIRKDRRGRLWFLGMAFMRGLEPTADEPGAFVYEDGKFTRWSTQEGLIGGRTYAFAEGLGGDYWFGTASGLSRWKDGAWTHWTTEQGLNRDRIFTIAVDHDGRLWFSDQFTGLGYIDDDDTARYLTTAEGLINDEVQDLHVDPIGRLWISTRGGLTCYHDGTWSHFGTSSGLNDPHLWPVYGTGDEVYVGTIGHGLSVLDLGGAEAPTPQVVLEEPVIDDDYVFVRWQAFGFWGEMPSDDIETRFRIGSEVWSEWSVARDARLDGLEPGEHTFMVQAKGLFGQMDERGSTSTFIIPAPWYMRPRFVLPVGGLLLVVFLLTATMIGRRRRHESELRAHEERHREHLERRVDQRTEALRESEARLRMLVETTHVIPWEADAKTWNFTYVGPQAEEILGYPLESWYESGFWTDHIHPEDVDFAVDYCLRSSKKLIDFEFEYRMIAADGRVVWLHDLVSTVTKDGELATLRGFMIDITDRKRAELERLEAEAEARDHRERLAHISRINMLGEMATGIAHEVNQPLTAISTYTQACRRMMEQGSIAPEGVADVLGRISDEAVRAGSMIHQLKALVRKRQSERTFCDINALIRDVVPLAEVDARGSNVTLELQLDDELPRVYVDNVQIQQVVLNLVRNGVEATDGSETGASDNGRGSVTVRTTSGDNGDVRVEVADQGEGLSAEAEDRLFTPFFSTKASGMGMGLSISKTIIESHGGQLDFRTNPEGGMTFLFSLPVMGEATPADA